MALPTAMTLLVVVMAPAQAKFVARPLTSARTASPVRTASASSTRQVLREMAAASWTMIATRVRLVVRVPALTLQVAVVLATRNAAKVNLVKTEIAFLVPVMKAAAAWTLNVEKEKGVMKVPVTPHWAARVTRPPE